MMQVLFQYFPSWSPKIFFNIVPAYPERISKATEKLLALQEIGLSTLVTWCHGKSWTTSQETWTLPPSLPLTEGPQTVSSPPGVLIHEMRRWEGRRSV